MSEPTDPHFRDMFVNMQTLKTDIKKDETGFNFAMMPIDMTEEKYGAVIHDLAEFINNHSLENGSKTPDFILAKYMLNALFAFEAASKYRENWYGKSLSIGGGETL